MTYAYGRFDFGLDDEQEARAERLLRESIVCDLLFQGPTSPDVWTEELVAELEAEGRNDLMSAYVFLIERAMEGRYAPYEELLKESGVTTLLGGCTLVDKASLLDAAAFQAKRLRAFPWLRQARTADDIRAAHAAGEHASWGICQTSRVRPGDLDLIDAAHALGVMDVVDCAYNVMNFVGAGCTERYDPGLSHFGLEFVRRCNHVGVIVDTAHSGRQTTLDACAASEQPVIASHTSAAAVFEHDRAKSDEELQAIAASGGVIGVYVVPFFLAPSEDENPTIELFLDHVDYIAKLVGWEHVAVGTDYPLPLPAHILERVFFGQLGEFGFRPEHGLDDPARCLDGYRDARDWANIPRGLVARGYDDEQIRGIVGENFLRVFEKVVG